MFGLFFYPLAMAHLGVNDIIDVANDRVKDLKTISRLFGMSGATYWVLLFTLTHVVTAILFLSVLGAAARLGFFVGFALLAIANYLLLKKTSAQTGMRALPFFHVAMLIYAASIILSYFL